MSKTKAQLEAELEALKQRHAALEERTNRGPRERFPGNVWENPRKTTPKHPDWTGSVRLVIPEDAKPGEPFWLDISVWEYIDGVSPATFEDNPPVFSLSFSPCSPSWAREQEQRREAALKKRGRIH